MESLVYMQHDMTSIWCDSHLCVLTQRNEALFLNASVGGRVEGNVMSLCTSDVHCVRNIIKHVTKLLYCVSTKFLPNVTGV